MEVRCEMLYEKCRNAIKLHNRAMIRHMKNKMKYLPSSSSSINVFPPAVVHLLNSVFGCQHLILLSTIEMCEFLMDNKTCTDCFYDSNVGVSPTETVLTPDSDISVMRLLRSHSCIKFDMKHCKVTYNDTVYLDDRGYISYSAVAAEDKHYHLSALMDRSFGCVKGKDEYCDELLKMVSVLVYSMAYFKQMFNLSRFSCYNLRYFDVDEMVSKLEKFPLIASDGLTD